MSTSKVKADKVDTSEVKFDKFSYQWKIKNFRYLHMQPGNYLDSPVFSFGSKKHINWFIRLYPDGYAKVSAGYLSLFLYWEHNKIIKGQYKLSLINDKDEKRSELTGVLEHKVISSPGTGYGRFLARAGVLDEASGLLPNDCLTIHCEIVVTLDVYEIGENGKRLSEQDKEEDKPNLMEKLFLEEQLSDVKLIASCGKSLPAHRSVLAASSPVFKAMFTHEMLEQRQGEVKIEDAAYEVIKEMLRFIYLGRVEDIETTALELFRLAYKYQIADLTKLFEEAVYKKIPRY